jgi:hypothetical protein
MLRLAATLLLLTVAPAYANTAAPTPVCAEPSVLHAIRQRLSRPGQPARLEENSVGQVSARANLVYCAVRVHVTDYNTNQFGRQPIDAVSTYDYVLELRPHAIFLRPGR